MAWFSRFSRQSGVLAAATAFAAGAGGTATASSGMDTTAGFLPAWPSWATKPKPVYAKEKPDDADEGPKRIQPEDDDFLLRDHTIRKWNYNWDGRQTEEYDPSARGKNPNPTHGVRHLYLIRHGQYNTKAEHRDDRRLTDTGRQQAEATGKRLAALGLAYTAFVNSTMIRAVETADIIFDQLPPKSKAGGGDLKRVADQMLEEGAPIPPDPPASSAWRVSPSDFLQEGSRIDAAFLRYFFRPKPDAPRTDEVYVCHANVIRYFICRSLQLPLNAWLRMSLANGSITHVMITADGIVSVRGIGHSAHLPPDLITYN